MYLINILPHTGTYLINILATYITFQWCNSGNQQTVMGKQPTKMAQRMTKQTDQSQRTIISHLISTTNHHAALKLCKVVCNCPHLPSIIIESHYYAHNTKYT